VTGPEAYQGAQHWAQQAIAAFSAQKYTEVDAAIGLGIINGLMAVAAALARPLDEGWDAVLTADNPTTGPDDNASTDH